MSRLRPVTGRIRRIAASASQRRNVGDYSPDAWLTELGVRRYEPGPWSTSRWDEAYDSGQLAYFGQLAERGRFAVCADYLDVVLSDPERSNTSAAVLDIGCGDGVLQTRCRHLDIGHWCGVDLSTAAIRKAQTSIPPGSDDRLRFLVGDALEDGPWYDRPYDVVVISEVLNMCESPARLLDRVADVVAPGGSLIVSSWRHRGDRQLQSLLRGRFPAVHHVDLRPADHNLAPRGWRVSLHSK